MYGIISEDHLPGHCLFQNFRYALLNHFNTTFKDVKGINDLADIKTLFIVDEHFGPHVDIWKKSEFIDAVNAANIKVIIFNFEKIYDAQFPWNVDHQRWVERFKNRLQLVSDMNDSQTMNLPIINKQLLSSDTNLKLYPQDKENKILFIGQIKPHVYTRRKKVLNDLMNSHLAPHVVVIDSDRKYQYVDYVGVLSKYRFVFNPLGTGDFLNLRFYEALSVGAIPIQQVTQAMRERYSELEISRCFTFENVSDLPQFEKIASKSPTPFNYYLEDYFNDINLKSMI